MAVPFNIPETEQNDVDQLLNQRLLDLYHLLYQILIQRQPRASVETLESVNVETPEVVTALEAPFVVDYEVRSNAKRKKIKHHYKQEIMETDLPQPVSTVQQQRSPIYQDWAQVGRNLRQIADNFHQYKNTQLINETESKPEQYFGQDSDLITTIVSISPFRDSIWSAVFVVGCRMLTNAR